MQNKENQRQLPERETVDVIRGLIGIGMNGTEVSLCRKGEKYFQTVKNADLGYDSEIELNKDQFDILWKATEGQRIEESDEDSNEIERKFLVERLPENFQDLKGEEMIQGYVAICEKDKTEVRLRKEGDKYFETIKKGSGKTRLEVQIEVTKEQFDAFWETTNGQRVEKIRYKIPREGGKPIELDIYRGKLDGLLTAEVEFPTEKESNLFDSKRIGWFGEEVTEDKRFKNQYLALHGIPDAA